MNCRRAQEKPVDAIASRESGLCEDPDQQWASAPDAALLASQASLASAIDSHLRLGARSLCLFVNCLACAPGSSETAPRQSILRWQFAAVATVVVLLVAAAIRMRDSDKPGSRSGDNREGCTASRRDHPPTASPPINQLLPKPHESLLFGKPVFPRIPQHLKS
jgi:hypothetical protein